MWFDSCASSADGGTPPAGDKQPKGCLDHSAPGHQTQRVDSTIAKEHLLLDYIEGHLDQS